MPFSLSVGSHVVSQVGSILTKEFIVTLVLLLCGSRPYLNVFYMSFGKIFQIGLLTLLGNGA